MKNIFKKLQELLLEQNSHIQEIILNEINEFFISKYQYKNIRDKIIQKMLELNFPLILKEMISSNHIILKEIVQIFCIFSENQRFWDNFLEIFSNILRSLIIFIQNNNEFEYYQLEIIEIIYEINFILKRFIYFNKMKMKNNEINVILKNSDELKCNLIIMLKLCESIQNNLKIFNITKFTFINFYLNIMNLMEIVINYKKKENLDIQIFYDIFNNGLKFVDLFYDFLENDKLNDLWVIEILKLTTELSR